MMKFAFAKEVVGGYRIANLGREAYTVTNLPQKCDLTGFPVILCSDVFDYIENSFDMAGDHVERFMRDLDILVGRFNNEIQQAIEVAQASPGNYDFKAVRLGYLIAASVLSKTIVDSFANDAKLGNNLTKRNVAELEVDIADLAAENGIYIPEKLVKKATPEQFVEELLKGLFGARVEIVNIENICRKGRVSV